AGHGASFAGNEGNAGTIGRGGCIGRGAVSYSGRAVATALRRATRGIRFTKNQSAGCAGGSRNRPPRRHLDNPMSLLLRSVVIFSLLLCLWAAATPAVASPASNVFTYRRVFKSSVPEFIEIKIPESSGNASYEIRQLDEDAGSTPFEVGAGLR